MEPTEKQNEFLLKAKEADYRADKAKDETTKATWRTIADGYRQLAHHAAPKPASKI